MKWNTTKKIKVKDRIIEKLSSLLSYVYVYNCIIVCIYVYNCIHVYNYIHNCIIVMSLKTMEKPETEKNKSKIF
jgi:hypothetical protein